MSGLCTGHHFFAHVLRVFIVVFGVIIMLLWLEPYYDAYYTHYFDQSGTVCVSPVTMNESYVSDSSPREEEEKTSQGGSVRVHALCKPGWERHEIRALKGEQLIIYEATHSLLFIDASTH